MTARRWSSVSYLDAIRPDPGWRTEYAFLASYSADLVALVAALLALAGLDDDRGSGSKVDFANAVDTMAGRARLIIQAGRLVAPARTPKILAILDRYVREVAIDEFEASWHPKAALAKHVSEGGDASEWRLWIGSRNLTRDLSWDVGLTLVGHTGGRGSEVPGVPEMGQNFAILAELSGVSPGKVRSELRQVRWESPPGCSIKSLHLLHGNAARSLPSQPSNIRKVIVVSPFLDGTVVGTLGKWGDGDTHRTLVSSRPELAKLATQTGQPLVGFQELLFLDAPVLDEHTTTATEVADRENATSQDEEPEPRGLHAKLIYAESSSGRQIWTGSANLTERGWIGPNTEVIAEIEVTPDVAVGLTEFIQTATTVRADELGAAVVRDETEERLERARKQVAGSWSVVQRYDQAGPLLLSPTDPNPEDPAIELSVGLLAALQVPWPRGDTTARLPQVTAGAVTEFVCCRLTLGEASVSWLQRAPIDPPPGAERDRYALSRYLDPRTFLLWIRSLLTGDACGDGGGDWDCDATSSTGGKVSQVGPTWWAPTIEEILHAWSRDPSSLILIDRKVRHYLKLYQEQVDLAVTAEERLVVDEFYKTWQVLRIAMVTEQK